MGQEYGESLAWSSVLVSLIRHGGDIDEDWGFI
jgi:hypothetical protein